MHFQVNSFFIHYEQLVYVCYLIVDVRREEYLQFSHFALYN
jgi:hypothetical protein